MDDGLRLVGGLADEGLFRIGDLTGPGNRFVAWDGSVEDSLRRVRSEYVDKFDLTAEGERVAREMEETLNQSSDTGSG